MAETLHVFLGAPQVLSGEEEEEEEGGHQESLSPAGWRTVCLAWEGGGLRPLSQGPQRSDSPRRHGRLGSAQDEEDVSSSLQAYLDSCFSPRPPPLSAHSQYLSTWTLGHALLLRPANQSGASPEKALPVSHGSPELYSPVRLTHPSLLSSAHPAPLSHAPPGFQERTPPPLPPQKWEEGGVVLEATPDGLLCSQVGAGPEEAPPPPGGARARPTPLAQCGGAGRLLSVLVAAVHPCHLQEVTVRSGACVALASTVVIDQSGVEMKVVFWRRAAFWTLAVLPADVLLLTGLQVHHNSWRGETVLQTTYGSRLLNLGQITTSTSPPAPHTVCPEVLSCLCEYLRSHRPLLVSLPPRAPTRLDRVRHAHLGQLRSNSLVHLVLRVTHIQTGAEWRRGVQSSSRRGSELKAVVTVEQVHSQHRALVLWGSALAWLPALSSRPGAFWEFRFLLVRDSLTSDLPELNSTPWSSAHPLPSNDVRLRQFQRSDGERNVPELDLNTLLSQSHTGDVELRVRVLSLHFQCSPSQNAPVQVLDSSSPSEGVVAVLAGDVTYAGCGHCALELDVDANGVYCPCYPCLPHTGVRRYYRPASLTVSQADRQVCVQVSPLVLQRLLATPPDRLHKCTAPGSEVRSVHLAADRIVSLLSPDKTVLLTLRCHFLCDENSVPISQDFLLLDFQL